MIRYSSSRTKGLRFENLEPRLLLAADLHAAVEGGDLVIVGSKGADVLSVEASADRPDSWTITPARNDSINGEKPGQSVTLSGIVGDLRVFLRDGNDTLTIKGQLGGSEIPGNLSIRGSRGTNRILIESITTGDDLSIRTRGAADELSLMGITVNGDLVIRSAAGADSIVCSGVAVEGSLDVHAGGGRYNDEMTVRAATVAEDLLFRSTRGDNHLGVDSVNVGNRIRVHLGPGNDYLAFGSLEEPSVMTRVWPQPPLHQTTIFTQQLQIHTGSGNDTVEIADTEVSRHLRASLGDDDDRLTVHYATVGGNGIIDAGKGDDVVEAGAWVQGSSYTSSLWPFAGETDLDGGQGNDTLRRSPSGDPSQLHWSHWEEIVKGGAMIKPLPEIVVPFDSPADAVNSFAADLYHKLADSAEDFVFSPLSISAALAMVYAGAEADTAAEMAKILHFPESSEEFHAAYGELLNSLNQADALEGLDLNVANSLWGQSGFPFNQDYLDLILASYNGGLQDVDFVNQTEAARQAINGWVEEQTRDKIQDLIPQGVLTPETVLVLANAIYFDAKWAHEFDVYATQPDSFDVSADEEMLVDMMHDTANYNYMECDGVQYVELPYRDGRFSMLLALPGDGTPLSRVDVTAMTDDLSEFLSGLELQRVAVSLPKFEVTSMPDVKQALLDLGMEDLFDPDLSDLDGMVDPQCVLEGNLFVQDIRHKAFIELDEAGTTAAAATAVIVGLTSSMPPQAVYFTADHPFQYYICDTQTDTILFMGHVSRPTEAKPIQVTRPLNLDS